MPPNILLFITDDHAPWTLPCYGNGESHAPTLDLAREGIVFNNAFTPTPVCSPGRACLLTGLTASQHGVRDWIAMHDPRCQERDWRAGQLTLPEILNHSGYRCRVKDLPRHNTAQKPAQVFSSEAWRDGIRESRGF